MKEKYTILMAGGGTGGHVMPLLAVGEELRRRGHEVCFVGTRSGFEARLVPARGFPIEWISIGGLNRVSWRILLRSLLQLPLSTIAAFRIVRRWRPQALFSLGGYAAGPVMIAAWLSRIPMVLMEPNAIPGMTNRRMAAWVRKALISFPEAARYFPDANTEVTGLPVRAEFFQIPERNPKPPFTLLVTGGSRGARRLNTASREAWPLFREAGIPMRFVLQCGASEYETLAAAFRESGLDGEVTPFLEDMAGAYASADLILSRAGAGGVSEIAAAGRAAVLVPFPYAADDHQTANARALEAAGAARVIPDAELTGERLFQEVTQLFNAPGTLRAMGKAARRSARPAAAQRAADLLIEFAERRRES